MDMITTDDIETYIKPVGTVRRNILKFARVFKTKKGAHVVRMVKGEQR